MIHYRIVSELLIPIDAVQDARELLRVGKDILKVSFIATLSLSAVDPCV